MKKNLARAAALILAIGITFSSIGLVKIVRPATQTAAIDLLENYTAPSVGLDISAASMDGSRCIPTDTGFLLTLTEPLKEKELRQWLQLSPEFAYTLQQGKNELEYRLEPKEPFRQGTVYTLSFDPLQTDNGMPARAGNSWAFQTQAGFALERTFPGDEGTGVPVQSAIELTFTADVSPNDLAKHVTIQPALQGSWGKISLNTYAFLPEGGMQEGTIYEVRVAAALTDELGSEALGREHVFKFRTHIEETAYWSSVSHENNAFMSSEKPVFHFTFSPSHTQDTIPVKVLRFGSVQAYAEAVENALNYTMWSGQEKPVPDPSSLTPVLEAQLERMGDENTALAVLPQTLPKGFYAAQFTTGGRTLTSLFQVTDLSAYAVSGSETSLLWVNDLQSTQPVMGAQLTKMDGNAFGKTNANGVLLFNQAPEEKPCAAFLLEKGEDRLLLLLHNPQQAEAFNRNDYWNYIYTDKRLYAPSDTLKFFGVAAPKQAGTKDIKEITAVVESNDWDATPSSAVQIKVPVKNGVFEGQLQLPELPPDHYCLSIYYGEQRLSSTYFEAALYKKPAYKLSLELEHPIVWAGQTTSAIATAAYFDGTPAAQLDIKLQEAPKTTDAFGQAKVSITTKADPQELISYVGVSADAVLPEIGQVYANSYIQSVNSSTEVQAIAKRGKDGAVLELQPFKVDFSGLDVLDWYDTSAMLKPYSGTLPLTVRWTRIVYTKTPTGEKSYDPYTKTVTEQYSYERSEQPGGSKTITLNGKDKQTFTLPLEAQGEYTIQLEGKDSTGRRFVRTAYLYDALARSYSYDFGKTAYVRENSDKGTYPIGSAVSLSVYENHDTDKPIAVKDGAVLFFRTSDVFIDYTVSKDNLLEFTFDGSVLPNINVFGVLFDGREYVDHYYPYYASVDKESVAPQLTVTPDKESYTPGSTAKLSLKLTDPAGKPIQGTVNLNMVDEALLALREEYADIADMFLNTYDYLFSATKSHILVRNSLGGEKGEGGGEGDRSDFRDTALFKTIETDKDGMASVEVKLPDNITSWRLFWQAFRQDGVLAGSGKSTVVTTLPFFADVRMADTFLAGDQPVLGLRNAGTALRGGNVQYTADIPSLKFSKSEAGALSVWHTMALPALTAGKHDYRIAAAYNEHKDSIAGSFTAAQSMAAHTKTETAALTGKLKFNIAPQGAVQLRFYDKPKAQTMSALQELTCGSAIRAEQVIARHIAQLALSGITPGETVQNSGWEQQITAFQRDDGSVAPFTYGDVTQLQTITATAWACAAAADLISKPAAAGYLYSMLDKEYDTDSVQKAIAVMGLAALGEPVLPQITQMQRSGGVQEKIYLALAQVFIGNGRAAKSAVQAIIKEFCEVREGGKQLCVQADDTESVIHNTANLTAAAVLLDMEEGTPLYQFTLENEGVEDRNLLQRAIALRHKARSVSKDYASFRYTLDGEEKQIKLYLCHSLLLSAKQLKDIRFSNISSGVEVTAFYTAAGFPQGSSSALQLKQSYPPIDTAKQGSVSAEITYSIAQDCPEGYYEIAHVLPAGLAFSSLQYHEDNPAYVVQVNGQQVTFALYKRSGTIRFTARPVMTGTFRCEGTYVTNPLKPQYTNSIEGGTVTIQ